MDLTRQQQCEKLLDILHWKGAKAFNCFVEAIGNVQPDLAYLLTESEEGKSIILIFYIVKNHVVGCSGHPCRLNSIKYCCKKEK